MTKFIQLVCVVFTQILLHDKDNYLVKISVQIRSLVKFLHSAPATTYATRLDRMTIQFNSGSDRFKSRYFFFYLDAIRPCLVRRRFHTRKKTRSRRVTTDYTDVCRCRGYSRDRQCRRWLKNVSQADLKASMSFVEIVTSAIHWAPVHQIISALQLNNPIKLVQV